MSSAKPTVWVTLLFTGDDCDVVVTATRAEGINAVPAYLRERCAASGHETAGVELWVESTRSPGYACEFINSGTVEELIQEWRHDSYGEEQGRFEGPHELIVPAETINAIRASVA
jgi:hypothetical protein